MVQTLANEIERRQMHQFTVLYRSLNPLLMDYLIESHILKSVNQHPYLGVMLDKTMSFTSHINNTVSKASKILNFIKRSLSNYLQPTKESA